MFAEGKLCKILISCSCFCDCKITHFHDVLQWYNVSACDCKITLFHYVLQWYNVSVYGCQKLSSFLLHLYIVIKSSEMIKLVDSLMVICSVFCL